MQNIQTFFQRAIKRDFSRDFLFRVESINFGRGGSIAEDDLIYARSASLPSRSIVDIPVKYRGLEFHVPGSVTYGNAAAYSLNFYTDEDSSLYLRFLEESRRVFNEQGNAAPGPGVAGSGDYDTPSDNSIITLSQLNKELNTVAQFRLIGCSIRELGNIEYTMADGNGAVKDFNVTFAYQFYENPLPVTGPPRP